MGRRKRRKRFKKENPKNRPAGPGYVYLKDDGRDYKFGITNNPPARLRKYITENPRIKVLYCIETSCYLAAEKIERELISKTSQFRTWENSKEWVQRTPEVKDIFIEVLGIDNDPSPMEKPVVAKSLPPASPCEKKELFDHLKKHHDLEVHTNYEDMVKIHNNLHKQKQEVDEYIAFCIQQGKSNLQKEKNLSTYTSVEIKEIVEGLNHLEDSYKKKTTRSLQKDEPLSTSTSVEIKETAQGLNHLEDNYKETKRPNTWVELYASWVVLVALLSITKFLSGGTSLSVCFGAFVVTSGLIVVLPVMAGSATVSWLLPRMTKQLVMQLALYATMFSMCILTVVVTLTWAAAALPK